MPCECTIQRPAEWELGTRCQFAFPETHFADHGAPQCVFHVQPNDPLKIIGEKQHWSPQTIDHFMTAFQKYALGSISQGLPIDISGIHWPAGLDFSFLKTANSPYSVIGCGYQILGAISLDELNSIGFISFINGNSNGITFRDSTLAGPVSIRQLQINGNLDLTNTYIDNGIKLAAVQSLRSLNADNSEIKGGIDISASIGIGLSWKNARVSGRLKILVLTKPSGTVQFDRSVFEGDCDFSESVIANGSFAECKFEKEAWFTECVFLGNVRFESCLFQEYADFHKASFLLGAYFDHSIFSAKSSFNWAAFENLASFTKCEFQHQADFGGGDEPRTVALGTGRGSATITGDAFREVHFCKAVFQDRVIFSNRAFKWTTNFENTRFTVAPEFHNARLHQDTDFSGAQFLDLKGAKAARAYRTLKLSMEAVRARAEEGRFFAYEQKCIRSISETSLADKSLSFMYEQLSYYGQSATRPLLWFSVTTVYFFSLFSAMGASIGPIHWHRMFRFTIEQYTQPFQIWSARYVGALEDDPVMQRMISEFPNSIRILTMLQTISGLAITALFLLAIRRKFRIVP